MGLGELDDQLPIWMRGQPGLELVELAFDEEMRQEGVGMDKEGLSKLLRIYWACVEAIAVEGEPVRWSKFSMSSDRLAWLSPYLGEAAKKEIAEARGSDLNYAGTLASLASSRPVTHAVFVLLGEAFGAWKESLEIAAAAAGSAKRDMGKLGL